MAKVAVTDYFSEKKQTALCTAVYIACLMNRDSAKEQYFTKALMKWHDVENIRSLPWKNEQDPYKIWLSEIILQQTRSEQGKPYYLKFTEAYPTIKDLAAAPDDEVFRLWQGLGYYNRCRNMLHTARYINNELSGTFPNTYEEILSLKGIGPYTAAAIASFAYGLQYAVVDGNVYRVLSRYFGIELPIDSTEGKKLFAELANALLHKNDSAGYNQAIMDLGATVCTPSNPNCTQCPVEKYCLAAGDKDMIAMLPVKSKKIKVNKRYFHYILFFSGNEVWVKQRASKDIWQGLHEFYLIEADTALTKQELVNKEELNGLIPSVKNIEYEGFLSQRLTHRIIESHFFKCQLPERNKQQLKDGKWVKINELNKFAYPKTIVSFLEKKSYF